MEARGYEKVRAKNLLSLFCGKASSSSSPSHKKYSSVTFLQFYIVARHLTSCAKHTPQDMSSPSEIQNFEKSPSGASRF